MYEFRGLIWPEFSRSALRHAGLLVSLSSSSSSSQQTGGGSLSFDCFHAVGTPGVVGGLQYRCERGWRDPTDNKSTHHRLLAMIPVGRMPAARYGEMDGLMRGVVVAAAVRESAMGGGGGGGGGGDWNCQDWVRAALHVMADAGLITREESDRAVERQLQAVAMPFVLETPNERALGE